MKLGKNDKTIQCSSCKQTLPATKVYFFVDNSRTNGLWGRCKECEKLRIRLRDEKLGRVYKFRYRAKDAIGRVCGGRCGLWKSWDNYSWKSINNPDRGKVARCKECIRADKRDFYAKYKDEPGFKEHANFLHNNYRQRIRVETFAVYGGKCACCGETHVEFLGIDHINGGGNQHRKQLKRYGVNFYDWLRQQGYPKEYQILCHNCNLAKGFFGYCPHEREQSE